MTLATAPSLALRAARAASMRRNNSTTRARVSALRARVFSSSPEIGGATDGQLPRVVAQETIFENPWLRLKTIRFLDQRGRERKWTGLERTTTYPQLSGTHSNLDSTSKTDQTDKCDAVVVFPFLTRAQAPMEVILIRQFRPPVGKWVIELPAGLIDGDEAPETAAIRELAEETGYVASRVLHMGPPMVNDQGITNGKCRLLLMQVRYEDQSTATPEQHLEDDEMIHVVRAPFDGVVPWLLERQETHGDAIDARLYSYALGLQALPAALLRVD